jgi:hypothetical protein
MAVFGVAAQREQAQDLLPEINSSPRSILPPAFSFAVRLIASFYNI